jgi:phosphoribosylglycinamide formyltransferase 2
VIYGGIDATGVAFEGVAQALAEPGTDIRLFGKPESFKKRRMGVGLASADTVEAARQKARRVSSAVRVR